MIYFTSDHHFYHANIIKHCNRPYGSVSDMNKDMIERWNDLVKTTDTVYYLGDFSMSSKWRSEELLSELNGTKILVAGNHDKSKTRNLDGWSSVHDYIELKLDKLIVLFHYPIASWNGKHHRSIHLHGHSHGTCPVIKHRIDVGVDCNNFTPVSLNDIYKKYEDNI